MRIGVPREIRAGERRVALVPESVKKLVKAGIAVTVERGAGESAFFTDSQFAEAGATMEEDATALFGGADLVLKVQAPARREALSKDETDLMHEGAMLLGTLVPARHADVIERLAARKITAFAIDLIPRITRAQSMDTLSSMANIAGYKAVLIAANHLPRYFPMLMTAAGTVFPAKVFVIGAGVAGLQAIATAHRIGAAVEATDTRPVVKEQVESIGAKFVGVVAEEAQDASGYAKELSSEFYRKQAELIAERCAASDVVITTALIGGVKAPRLITAEMVKSMKPGSVIVDLAAEAGGNCELTQPGRTVVVHGVTICGPENPPAEVPWHGSTLYSRNLTAFVLAFWKDGKFNLDLDDEIIKGCLVTHAGEIRVGKPAAKA
ncbi:MAG: Re/Si-specific NAD(P)(+) transhydrogenase subunit alpha [Thermoanaerobaculales bacterium]